jgi:hypothetical protein
MALHILALSELPFFGRFDFQQLPTSCERVDFDTRQNHSEKYLKTAAHSLQFKPQNKTRFYETPASYGPDIGRNVRPRGSLPQPS